MAKLTLVCYEIPKITSSLASQHVTMLCLRVILGFLRSTEFLVMITPTLVMFTIQISSMAILYTYLDISVRSTTQASHISSSFSCAGVATAAGELAKDEKHRDAVEETGCDFSPCCQNLSQNIWRVVSIHSSGSPLSPLLIAPQLEVVLLLDWLIRTCFSSFQCRFGCTM